MDQVRKPPAIHIDGAVVRHSATCTIGPVSFELPPGSVLGVVGSNGAGKTTLLRLLTGLVPAHAGTIAVYGNRVRFGHMPHSTGALIEIPAFVGRATGRENLLVACDRRREFLERIDGLMHDVGLESAASVAVSRYSQGMRQRLAIARSLLSDPDLLLLDEPTNGLDPEGIRWLRHLIKQRAEAGRTVVMSSHLLHEVDQVVSHVGVLYDGTCLSWGPRADVLGGATTLEDLYFGLLSGT